MQAIVRTSRLVLTPLADEHLDDEVALDADPEVMRYLGNGRARSRDVVEAHHARRLAEAVGGGGFCAGHQDGEFVGWWLLRLDDTGREAELGYRLCRRFWRRGLASEGAAGLVRHGFVDLGLDRIVAWTMAVNVASRTTMAALGMEHVHTTHRQWDEPVPGWEAGEVGYVLSRQAWTTRAG